MKKPKLIVLVGNIGAGKITLSKKYQEEGFVIISRDSIRYGIGGGNYIFNSDYEPAIANIALEMLAEFLEVGANILIDETNVSKNIRSEYLFIADTFDYEKIAVLLPKLSKEESVKRRMNNSHGNQTEDVWNMVWDNFNNIYDEPTTEEGFDKVIKL